MAARTNTSNPAPEEPTLPTHDENGVDLTLVRYTLSLTPSQRLKALENYLNAMSTVEPVAERRRN